jgi:hypothetical protein
MVKIVLIYQNLDFDLIFIFATRAFRTGPFRGTWTQTEVRISDSEFGLTWTLAQT